MKLRDWIESAKFRAEGLWGDAVFSSLESDSRNVTGGSLFVAMPSANRDTHALLPEVQKQGATACLVHSREGFDLATSVGLPSVWIDADPRITSVTWPGSEAYGFHEKLGQLCSAFYGDPTAEIRVVGVTGTNGKTTVAWLLAQALDNLGSKSAYLGTLGLKVAGELQTIPNTTPFPVELWKLIQEAVQRGADTLVMEVSSHALAQQRVAGVRFDVGIFTNLTQDHLDFHLTLEEYSRAKRLLFSSYALKSEKPFVAVLNAEDPVSEAWISDFMRRDATVAASAQTPVSAIASYAAMIATYEPRVLTYGESHGALRARAEASSLSATAMSLEFQGEQAEFEAALGGKFNEENLRACAAGLAALGCSMNEISGAMDGLRPAAGRFEALVEAEVTAIVDYAHTPDAVEKLLLSVRQVTMGRVLTAIGCGGDRDRTKRPIMASIACRLSDYVVLTSDNPRTENQEGIFKDMVEGVKDATNWSLEPDRAVAIQELIAMAEPGDAVVICGKGHENYQIVGKEYLPFSDRDTARAALEAKK